MKRPGAALTAGLAAVELKEIVYQAVPYVGMAKVFDFLHATNDVLTERGLPLPLPTKSATTPATRLERGLAVQKQIVGGERVDAMYAAAPEDEKHVQRYLSANCFTRQTAAIMATGIFPLSVTPAALGRVSARLSSGNLPSLSSSMSAPSRSRLDNLSDYRNLCGNCRRCQDGRLAGHIGDRSV
jgi:hypothetical protein